MRGMVDRTTLTSIAEQVRCEHCPPGSEVRAWSVGMCQFILRVLAQRLAAAGLAPRVVDGYYTATDDSNRTCGTRFAVTTTWDGACLHWWIECEDYVVDVMVDRVRAVNAGEPPVVVVPKNDAAAYSARLPSRESPHPASGRFEQ